MRHFFANKLYLGRLAPIRINLLVKNLLLILLSPFAMPQMLLELTVITLNAWCFFKYWFLFFVTIKLFHLRRSCLRVRWFGLYYWEFAMTWLYWHMLTILLYY